MKKYTNMSNEMRCVVFEDGSSQFLMRGQSIVSDKSTKIVEKGIKVTNVRRSKKVESDSDSSKE